MFFRKLKLNKIITNWMIFCSIYCTVEAYSSCIGWTNVKDYNNCLTEVISNLGPELARGISDFNLPPLDPYDCPSLNLKYNLPFFTIRLNISDYQIIDATKYIVQSVNVNPYNLTLNVNVKIPQIVTKLNYNVKGTVLFLNVTGIGKFEGNSTDILASITANGKNVTDENNVERVTLDKVKVRLLRISGVKVKMTSSSPKFRSVAKATQDLINTFSDRIVKVANPLLEGIADKIAKDLFSLILSSFTRKEIIPTLNIRSQQ